jgi:hypothetical protein
VILKSAAAIIILNFTTKVTKKTARKKRRFMSLDNIQLPPALLQELYKTVLVDYKDQSDNISAQENPINILGKNQQKIAIIVDTTEAVFLPDDQFNFLTGILGACKLTIEDVAIINIQRNSDLTYTSLTNELKATKIFLFGPTPAQLGLPITFPHYQVQSYNKQVYLSSPSLALLQNDKAEKTKLWLCLKQIFSI